MAFRHHVHSSPERGMTVIGPEHATCSAKGCQSPAAWDLLWNNPRLHTPERRKIWLACDEHRPSLTDFLGSRAFLKDVEAHDPDRDDPGRG
ncbi:hypothetical protein [Nocardioides sp. W7]|uniref:hypothetical protein n=1 Tax=Nocardioides sp. W7 TaxID=2931390 RepID=UPI0032AF3916